MHGFQGSWWGNMNASWVCQTRNCENEKRGDFLFFPLFFFFFFFYCRCPSRTGNSQLCVKHSEIISFSTREYKVGLLSNVADWVKSFCYKSTFIFFKVVPLKSYAPQERQSWKFLFGNQLLLPEWLIFVPLPRNTYTERAVFQLGNSHF